MFISFYSGIPFLGLSTAAAGIYTAPIFITLLSAYAIGEPVGPRRWLAVVLGFAGVLFILQPGTEAFSLWTVLPVLGGFFYALTNVTTRSKCQDVPSAALSLSLNLALLLTGIVFSCAVIFWRPAGGLAGAFPYLFGGWSVIGAPEWAAIALLAGFVVAIQMALAGAYQAAPPSIVATFDYSYLIFAAIWDYLFFAIVPSGMTSLGMLLIVAAGALVLRR
jgi:drug/metabolite transporter (DMT)-like permease